VKIISRKVKLQLKDGTWTDFLNETELKAHWDTEVKAAHIEEIMSYEDAMRYLRVWG